MLTMKEIGENIKKIREINNKSVYDLEKEIKISHVLQYRWEKGLSEPSIINCLKLANYYSISIDELIGTEYQKIEHNT